MAESESLRAEAARRGVSLYRVRAERERQATGATYRQQRTERQAQQRIRGMRAAGIELPSPEGREQKTPNDPHGFQGPYSPSPDFDTDSGIPDWDYYWPTRTSDASRPRTRQARYSSTQQLLEVIFDRPTRSNPGGTWHYWEVPPEIWTRFKRTESPGKYINAVLNGFPYAPGGWGSIVGE